MTDLDRLGLGYTGGRTHCRQERGAGCGGNGDSAHHDSSRMITPYHGRAPRTVRLSSRCGARAGGVLLRWWNDYVCSPGAPLPKFVKRRGIL
jgi:hypothetical protein